MSKYKNVLKWRGDFIYFHSWCWIWQSTDSYTACSSWHVAEFDAHAAAFSLYAKGNKVKKYEFLWEIILLRKKNMELTKYCVPNFCHHLYRHSSCILRALFGTLLSFHEKLLKCLVEVQRRYSILFKLAHGEQIIASSPSPVHYSIHFKVSTWIYAAFLSKFLKKLAAKQSTAHLARPSNNLGFRWVFSAPPLKRDWRCERS